MFRNETTPTEWLSEADLEVIENGWKRLVREIGIEFMHQKACELLEAAGQRVEGETVFFDPDWVLDQVALAPEQFHVHARDAAYDVTIGGNNMVFSSVSGPPFFRQGDQRRDGTLADYSLMAKLVGAHDEIDLMTTPVIEPDDAPLDSRHLDMHLAAIAASPKPFFGSALSTAHAEDSIHVARLLVGEDRLVTAPTDADPWPGCAAMTIVNVNSPLRYDTRMLEALFAYTEAGQAVVVTPFLLMGAMSPVTVPSALAQQCAEALTGIALMQLIRPGTPAVMGSFLSTIDMQSGSPSFGGPESAQGLLASGQLARRYRLPWRAGGGGLTASQTVDAQAGYEAFNTLQSAFAAHANLVVQAAGWLESGLVSSPEKFILDIEILQMLRAQFTPLHIDEESLAFTAHEEVGHGGHFLGAMHTLERFRDCFYRPTVGSTENFERWTSHGAKNAEVRTGEVWRKVIETYEPAMVDEEVWAALTTYADRRRHEVGDA